MHIFKLFRLVEFSKNFTIDDVVVFRRGGVRLAVNFAVVDPESKRSWEIVSESFPQSDLTFDVSLFREHGYLVESEGVEDIDKLRAYSLFDKALQSVYEKMYTRELVIQNVITEKQAELTKLEQLVHDVRNTRESIWGGIKAL